MTERTRFPHLPSVVGDVVLLVFFLAVITYEFATPLDDGARFPPYTLLDHAVAVLIVLPLLFRRRYPLTALIWSSLALIIPSIVVPQHTWLFWGGAVPMLVLAYSVGLRRSWTVSRIAWLIPVAATLAFTVRAGESGLLWDAAFFTVLGLLPTLIGAEVRRTTGHRRRLADAYTQLEQERARREQLALQQQRIDLARDFHDVVTHAISLTLIQAGAARLALQDGDAATGRVFLLGVQQATSDANADLKHMLDVLDTDVDPVSSTEPAGLTAIGALIERTRSAGLDITFTEHGDPPELSRGLDLAAYWILQEALTNILKHAGRTKAAVRITYTDEIDMVVEDDGPVPGHQPAPSSGHGLIGVHERVLLFGGIAETTSTPSGFRLHVHLPVPSSRQAPTDHTISGSAA